MSGSYQRPETGGCDAMNTSYNPSCPCSRKAIWEIDGHKLCERHAQSAALLVCGEKGLAKRIPNVARLRGLVYIQEAK